MNTKQLTEEKLKWVACDLDKTIAHNTGYPEFNLLEPIIGTKEYLDKLVANGYKIIIHTSRAWNEYDIIEKWLDDWKIPHRRIVCGKLFAKYYIDDRNIDFNGDWEEVYKKITTS